MSDKTSDAFRWQTFFQHAAQPIFLVNARRRLLFVNRAWEKCTGDPKAKSYQVYTINEPGLRARVYAVTPDDWKKYIAFNSFVWIDEGAGRRSPVVDDGTAPRNAKSTGSAAENWGSVPPNWVERSVTFMANNTYQGWRPEDLSQPGRWLDFETYPKQQRVTLVGPDPHAYPPPHRTVVNVGGEQTPTAIASRHAIADWFRL